MAPIWVYNTMNQPYFGFKIFEDWALIIVDELWEEDYVVYQLSLMSFRKYIGGAIKETGKDAEMVSQHCEVPTNPKGI